MSKLPPGFTHEMRHHLTHKVPDLDPLTNVPIIPLENFCCGQQVGICLSPVSQSANTLCHTAAHGFSVLIVSYVCFPISEKRPET
jgi:hypothetical protein